MEKVLYRIKGLCFFYAVCIVGKDRKEHDSSLKKVLDRLQGNGLIALKDKCEFFSDKIQFLGFAVDDRGVHADSGKVTAIPDASRTEDVHRSDSF